MLGNNGILAQLSAEYAPVVETARIRPYLPLQDINRAGKACAGT
ncbi:hypothetical protein CES85_1144 [Ochrobactrum quorumnocens]|uniref:Uncharacterized protein n=1 Tax=Ochrobactrum quorumnocens TaxID=271865 RepID=A0A248UFL3_9HYPH|nr:hypothetical protein CES85_1144 [[Ochrobactrum] quorumnocens]